MNPTWKSFALPDSVSKNQVSLYLCDKCLAITNNLQEDRDLLSRKSNYWKDKGNPEMDFHLKEILNSIYRITIYFD